MKGYKHAFFTVLILTILSSSLSLQAEKMDRNLERGFNSISPMDAYNYVKVLSSAEFAGRLTGHEGYTRAAEWAAQKFREWGLKPLSPKEGHLQSYPSPYTLVDKAEMTLHLKEKKGSAQEEPPLKQIKLDLKKDLQTYKKPLSFPLQSKISYRVASRHFPYAVGYNIVGYVEGSDPKLKKECLVVGGHFDHCDSHLGLLFAGADDNASGSAVVIEIAEAFSKLSRKPKRSVVFVLFGGEEMGLMGSNYFADHLPAQLEKVDTMFNFDMVGEGDGTTCILSPTPEELKKVIEEADKHVKTLRQTGAIRGIGVRSSDFAPFFLKGAACVAFFSNGPHLAYHQTGDTIYRINPEIMADIGRLAFLSAFSWADR